MNLPLYHLEGLRGYRLDSEDVAIIMDILGPELRERGISFCDISRKEALPKAYVTDKYQIAIMGGGNFQVRIMGYTSDTYVSYDSDKETWTEWSSVNPDRRIESKSITGLWLRTNQLRVLLEAFTTGGIQELINSEITFVNEE